MLISKIGMTSIFDASGKQTAVTIIEANKAQAMQVLAARIKSKQVDAQNSAIASERKSLIGSGDRSELIRTYNYPQGRITDHRINLTLYKIDAITEGDMDELIGALMAEHQADLFG